MCLLVFAYFLASQDFSCSALEVPNALREQFCRMLGPLQWVSFFSRILASKFLIALVVSWFLQTDDFFLINLAFPILHVSIVISSKLVYHFCEGNSSPTIVSAGVGFTVLQELNVHIFVSTPRAVASCRWHESSLGESICNMDIGKCYKSKPSILFFPKASLHSYH